MSDVAEGPQTDLVRALWPMHPDVQRGSAVDCIHRLCDEVDRLRTRAEQAERERDEPRLGLATTRELLTELRVRGEVSAMGEGEPGAAHLGDTAADLLVVLPDALLDYSTTTRAALGDQEQTDE